MKAEAEAMKAEQIIRNAVDRDPNIRIVLDIAARAHEAESKEPPLFTGMATDTVALPKLQSPVPPVTPY